MVRLEDLLKTRGPIRVFLSKGKPFNAHLSAEPLSFYSGFRISAKLSQKPVGVEQQQIGVDVVDGGGKRTIFLSGCSEMVMSLMFSQTKRRWAGCVKIKNQMMIIVGFTTTAASL